MASSSACRAPAAGRKARTSSAGPAGSAPSHLSELVSRTLSQWSPGRTGATNLSQAVLTGPLLCTRRQALTVTTQQAYLGDPIQQLGQPLSAHFPCTVHKVAANRFFCAMAVKLSCMHMLSAQQTLLPCATVASSACKHRPGRCSVTHPTTALHGHWLLNNCNNH